MKSTLAGRTICIIGGNGFVGTALAHQAVNLGAKVFAVSRSGTPSSKSDWANRVQWVKGDSLNPDSFKDVLEESESVVHTVGVLLDSTITQFKKPGDDGSYEQMNRDTAISIGKTLNDMNKNKKMIYLSASKNPPFITRYLSTKREAENYLLNLPHLRTTILRPGFISSDEAPGKKILSYPVGVYAHLTQFLSRVAGPNSSAGDFIKKIEADTTVDVRAVALSALIASFDPKFDGKILYNEDMETLKGRFLERGYEFPSKSE